MGTTPLAWLKAMPIAPKADHIRELLDRLNVVREIGVPADNAGRIHENRLQQFVREGHASDAHQLGRYSEQRRRAIVVATALDLETRLTDAVLDMADKLIGGLFAKARNAARRRYAASASDVGRLMRLFHGTIEALAAAQESDADAFEAVNDAVGWPKLLRVRDQVQELADLAGEDPLVRAGDPKLAALTLLAGLNQSGKREVPADAPMPFRKEWRRLVMEEGGHDPGLGFYTHVSDQHGPYSVRVMSATSHEAPYVLDGLMHHGTALRIGTHYTDTGGVSDHVFILCAMLGFRFCPRLRDMPDRKLATIEPATAYKDLAPLIGRRIKADVIREHWGEILRLVASLQAGIVLPSAMLKRLAAFQRQNQLDLALQELGRVERTLFMLDWLESPGLRQRCQAGLNKSEQRHALAQVICTFKQGRIADRGQEAQQFCASGLNLVIAAIVYWNSTYLADAVQHLRDQGKPVPDVLLAHTSPLTWEHIGFSGDFLWDRAAATADRRRPLNLGRGRVAA